jgi:hypothetical protein
MGAGMMGTGASRPWYFSGWRTCSVDSGGRRKTSSMRDQGWPMRMDSTKSKPAA